MNKFNFQIYYRTILPNIVISMILFLYSKFIVKVSAFNFFASSIIIVSIVIVLQAILTPFLTRKFLTQTKLFKIKEDKGTNTDKDRTVMLKAILRFPIIYSIKIFMFFAVFSIVIFGFYYIKLQIDILTCFTSFIGCIVLSYTASLFLLDILENFFVNYAEKIVSKGVDVSEFTENHFFGNSIMTWQQCYIIAPTILTNIFLFAILLKKYFLASTSIHTFNINEMLYISILISINTLISIFLSRIVLRRLERYTKTMIDTLYSLCNNDILRTELIPTDLSNEYGANMYQINNVIKYFRSLYIKNYNTGASILTAANNLSKSSIQTSSVSKQQSSGINNILSVMEKSENSSRNTAIETESMAKRAKNSVAIVQESFDKLNINLIKMQEITESNIDTISGIKELSEKINSIWEIVTMIEQIAEQTNIIAFNAELESSLAGEEGQKFHIVANEVHRLASNITDSVNEIKKRITTIQHASDNLIISSESGTEKIRDGCNLSVSLESKFHSISSSSEITAESANEITDIVNQQNSAFEQIVLTIRQLAIGIESFTESTATISEATEQLQKIAGYLINDTVQKKDTI